MAELGQQTVEFSTLVRRAAEDSYLSLKELVDKSKSSEQSDSEKKISLLKYIVKTRQRMLRLHVLAKWCQQVPLVQYCQQLSSTLSSHDTCFTQTADSLFFMHEGLQQARAPMYDVPSAIEVLLTGSYKRMSKCIEDMGMQNTLTEDEQKPVLQKLNTLLRAKLLEVSIPQEFSEIRVSDGTALLRVEGEFKVLLTLGYRGYLSLWRILHLELLVGEQNGLVKLEEMRRHALGDDLERRMAVSDNPFMLLYSILHELCVALIMDTVIRQVQALRAGRWKDAIRFELISDGTGQGGNSVSLLQMGQDGDGDSAGQKTPGLKIMYWIDSERSTSGTDLGSSPFIKIEPGQDLQIRCSHSTFVIDPITGKEAQFRLDQSCIDVEKLLLKAITCNKHTRLLEIHKELGKNGQLCRTTGDIVLKCHGDESDTDFKKKDSKSNTNENGTDEVLLVRAYGASYITLGINIRTGRFLLHASKNILAQSALSDCGEALNQGSMSAAEVFMSLRCKSIQQLFASIGKFLGLKVYEQGSAAVKIPKTLINDADLLLIGFPQCGNSYYLLMQLDKDFKPLFKLLETQPEPSGQSHAVGESNQLIRLNKIDIGQIRMTDDELSLSLLDWEELLFSLPNVVGRTQTSDSLLGEFGLETSMQVATCPQSSFSSVVDEVFEFEKGVSMSSYPIKSHVSSSFNTSIHSNTVPVNHQGLKPGMVTSPNWESSSQFSQISIIPKVQSSGSTYNTSLYPSSNIKGLLQSGPANSFSSSSPIRGPSIQKLPTSKSEQELNSLKSPPHGAELGTMDEERPSRLLTPLRTTGSRVVLANKKTNGIKSPSNGLPVGPARNGGTGISWSSSLVCQTPESGVSHASTFDVPKHEKNPHKRSLSDIVKLIHSLQGVEPKYGSSGKRRKILETSSHPDPSQSYCPSLLSFKNDGFTYGAILAEANHGCAPPSVYVTAFLHVIRHCSLCIKHARLTSQMEALDIPYVEEVGLRTPSSNLWFRLPFARDESWRHICLRLGRPGSMYWDVKVNDQHFRDLWDLQKRSISNPRGSGVRIANTSDIDSHIRYDPEGVVLSYTTVEEDSIKKLVSDLRRLCNARVFALGMRKLLGVRGEDRAEEVHDSKIQPSSKSVGEMTEKLTENTRKAFRIEAMGLMSLRFSFGTVPGIMARFVVEWEAGKEGCTMHVSPDQLWPHTKFLEDFINGAEVASLLDCIRLTAGPLLALAGAIRPARMTGPVSAGIHGVPVAGITPIPSKPAAFVPSQGLLPSNSTSTVNNQPASSTSVSSSMGGNAVTGNHNLHNIAMLSVAGRGGPGIVPSSLLPIDVSVVLRGPYWIRIIYRKDFAVDMRCFAGDQVWLQPATPPKGGPAAGGSLPCPQFRPFIMEHVAQGLNALEPMTGGAHAVGLGGSSNSNLNSPGLQPPAANGNRINLSNSAAISRTAPIAGNQGSSLSRVSSAMLASSNLVAASSGLPLRMSPGTGVPVHVRGELNTAFIGLGDDGGYGGGWVPLAALKKVLRGILKYLGVLWLFAQLPDLLKEILGSILKENEGALLNLDQEQPALRFFVGGYVFAVSVHRVQLLLQVLSVKRFHHQQQQQQQQSQSSAQEELAHFEISEICDYFSRRVASEPYDASRVASFITLLTLPISVLREFLKLIAWKKGLSQAQSGEIASSQRPRIELSLENHSGWTKDENSEGATTSKSNIHYDRAHNSVDFGLTVVLDPAHIPHINAAGGAAWLPYCVLVRLRYAFGENPHVSFLGMEGSHGGRACWVQAEDWDWCKQRVSRAVEYGNSTTAGDASTQGRLRTAADTIQRALQVALQQLREGSGATSSAAT
ncbi:mediator of RNA polymerase II transcription subunit 14-like [Aristolochia californica]|uniref:mediator of RNA polymerase II transcription subunit 14-like n=1 Tax=Aristolochia californica TaxID=171875 RepID=UPI0035DCF33D